LINRLRLYSYNTDYPGLVDCEYPPGSGVEHINQTVASIAAVTPAGDTLTNNADSMWPTAEPWDTIWVVDKSKIMDIPYWPNYRAVSDQDFVYRYNDYRILDLGQDDPHFSLYLDVIETVYTWANPPLDEVIVYSFHIIPTKYDLKGLYYTINNTSDIGQLFSNRRSDDRVVYDPEYFLAVFEDGPGGKDGDSSAVGFQFFPPEHVDPGTLKPTFIWATIRALLVQDQEQYRYLIASGNIMKNQQVYSGCAASSSIGPFEVAVGDTLVLRMAQVLGT
jgi:hypothetical protein